LGSYFKGKNGKDRERATKGRKRNERVQGEGRNGKERGKIREEKAKQSKGKGKKNSLDLLYKEKFFSYAEMQKNYALIRKKASASPRSPTGALPLDPTGGLLSPRPPHFTPPILKS